MTGELKLVRRPQPMDEYAKAMFEAVAETCRLPESESKARLLCGLSHAVFALAHPPWVVKISEQGKEKGDQ